MSATNTRGANEHRVGINRIIPVLDPLLVGLLLTLLLTIAVSFALAYYDRNIRQYTFRVAAGSENGESYLIGKAIAAVVAKRYPNVVLDTYRTDGTEQNLIDLEENYAQFAMAQADIVNDYGDLIATEHARSVAVLYEDHFQLLACDPAIADFVAFTARLHDRSVRETVFVPLLGGQRISFLHIAEHLGLREDEHYTFAAEGAEPGSCGPETYDGIIFRVRLAGNEQVASYLRDGWRLIGIEQIEAMRLKNASLQPTVLPEGTYQIATPEGFSAVPPGDLETIAVQRLFLARDDVPAWLVYGIAEILNQSSPEVANTLRAYGFELVNAGAPPETRAYIEGRVIPLIPSIPARNGDELLDGYGVAVHPGANSFYKPNESWFAWANQNADAISLGATAATITISALLTLNRWIRRTRKDNADTYIREVSFLRGTGRTPPPAHTAQGAAYVTMVRLLDEKRSLYTAQRQAMSTEVLPPDDQELDPALLERLIDETCRLARLNEVFGAASHALDRDQISEESFRTFTEAYKTTREALEQRCEEYRRAISLHYVNQIMKLIDLRQSPITLQEHLDFIRTEAARVLTNELVFSRESFRTFVDAYGLAKGSPD